MMTRNDFELLANALKSERAGIERTYTGDKLKNRLLGFSYAVRCVIEVCKASNARFDAAKFRRACGL